MMKQVARRIEFQNRRGCNTTHGQGRIRRSVEFAFLERALAMNDPDVVLSIDRNSDRHPDEPVIRQWLRPQRVHFKHRRLYPGGLDGRSLLQQHRTNPKRGHEHQKYRSNVKITFHRSVPPSISAIPVLFTSFKNFPEAVYPESSSESDRAQSGRLEREFYYLYPRTPDSQGVRS